MQSGSNVEDDRSSNSSNKSTSIKNKLYEIAQESNEDLRDEYDITFGNNIFRVEQSQPLQQENANESIIHQNSSSNDDSLEYRNGDEKPNLTEKQFLHMIEDIKYRNNHDADGNKIKNRVYFDPENALSELFPQDIEGNYEIPSGKLTGNSNNGIYKVNTKNDAGETIPYFVKFVGNNPELQRHEENTYIDKTLLSYMEDPSKYNEYISNKESVTNKAATIRRFIKYAISYGVLIIKNDKIIFNDKCDYHKIEFIIGYMRKHNLLSNTKKDTMDIYNLPFYIAVGERRSSKGYKYNKASGINHFNTMADMHWQNILSEIFNDKEPLLFNHGDKKYEISFTPITKITTNNGKIMITKGTDKKVENLDYDRDVYSVKSITYIDKLLSLFGIFDMHYANVGSEYDEKSKTWKIEAFDIMYDNFIMQGLNNNNINPNLKKQLSSFYQRLFSKESIEKICNYLENKNMKYETKSYMNDVLKELSNVKRHLENRGIIVKNEVNFPKSLDEIKNYNNKEPIVRAAAFDQTYKHFKKNAVPSTKDIQFQLNNNLGTLYKRFLKKNGIDQGNINSALPALKKDNFFKKNQESVIQNNAKFMIGVSGKSQHNNYKNAHYKPSNIAGKNYNNTLEVVGRGQINNDYLGKRQNNFFNYNNQAMIDPAIQFKNNVDHVMKNIGKGNNNASASIAVAGSTLGKKNYPDAINLNARDNTTSPAPKKDNLFGR